MVGQIVALCWAQVPTRGTNGYLRGTRGPGYGCGATCTEPQGAGSAAGDEVAGTGEAPGPVGEGKGRSQDALSQGGGREEGETAGLAGRLRSGETGAPNEGRGRPGGESAAAEGLRSRLRVGEGRGGVAVPVIGVEGEGATKTRPGGGTAGGEMGKDMGNGTGPTSQKYLKTRRAAGGLAKVAEKKAPKVQTAPSRVSSRGNETRSMTKAGRPGRIALKASARPFHLSVAGGEGRPEARRSRMVTSPSVMLGRNWKDPRSVERTTVG